MIGIRTCAMLRRIGPAGLLVLAMTATLPAGYAAPAGGSPSVVANPWAANVEMGFTNPTGDGSFDTHALLGASLERFVREGVSWRVATSMHSFGDPALQTPFRTLDDEDLFAINGNLLYHWTDTSVQPFVTGGVGYYEYRRPFAPDQADLGVDVGGGLDFVTAPRMAIKLEVLFHQTAAIVNDTFVTGSAGVKFRW